MERQNTPVEEEHTNYEFRKWGLLVPGVFLIATSIINMPLKLSIYDLIFFLPRISQITDLKQNHSIEVSPQGSLFYVAVIMIILYIAWYEIIKKRAEVMNNDITMLVANVKEQINDDTKDILLKNCVSMMEQVDFEYKYLQAACAYNNQEPGVKYGGEVEWALGKLYLFLYLK